MFENYCGSYDLTSKGMGHKAQITIQMFEDLSHKNLFTVIKQVSHK